MSNFQKIELSDDAGLVNKPNGTPWLGYGEDDRDIYGFDMSQLVAFGEDQVKACCSIILKEASWCEDEKVKSILESIAYSLMLGGSKLDEYRSYNEKA